MHNACDVEIAQKFQQAKAQGSRVTFDQFKANYLMQEARAVQQRVGQILLPGGAPIGTAGSQGVRVMTGGSAQAEAMFAQLTKGAELITTKKPYGGAAGGMMAELPGGGRIGIRYLSKSGDAAIDLHDVPGIPFEKIHFGP